MSLSEILNNWVAGQPPTATQGQFLAAEALADRLRAKAFGITPENVGEILKERSHLFQSIYPILPYSPSLALETLWNLWLPIAMQLADDRQRIGRPFIQGILGGQGTGKTTMAAVLTLILKQLGYRACSLSLDDLYKTYAERLALKEQDPRLVWRGPPGTHDVKLGLAVLDQLRQGNRVSPVQVPRFDKSAWAGEGDRAQPEIIQNVDIVLFEGWFVGVRPIDPSAFNDPPPPILTPEDREFARDMNQRLRDYLPLWERLDQLIAIYPVNWRLSQQWRRQAEQQMIATGKGGMADEMVDRFVEYFWKALHPELFIKPLVSNLDGADLVIEIAADRSVSKVYRPADLAKK